MHSTGSIQQLSYGVKETENIHPQIHAIVIGVFFCSFCEECKVFYWLQLLCVGALQEKEVIGALGNCYP